MNTPTAMNAEVPFERPKNLTRIGWGTLAFVVIVVNIPLLHYYLIRQPPKATVSLPYQNDFSNAGSIASDFWSSGGYYRTVNGELLSPGTKNNPLWLKAELPQDVSVEFDVRSESAEGDIKVELFGDGTDHASGYVFIHGGWNNSMSIIARLDEHGVALQNLAAAASQAGGSLVESGVFKKNTRMRVEANPYPVQPGKMYHWKIERKGSRITWNIDDQPFMSFDDPFPLVGKWHNRFAFSGWESELHFDNLRITALK